MNIESTALPVHEAWSRVMYTVQSVRKTERANVGGGYNFRGIDATVNAVGPALRSEGVFVVPTNVVILADERVNGGKMRNLTIGVTWRVTGPAGDSFEGYSAGESFDSGDKATAKAHSVAYRTFLLQALCIPTDEPDPDTQGYEREPAVQPVTPYDIASAKTIADLQALRVRADKLGMLSDVRVSKAFDNRIDELNGVQQ